MKLPKAIQELWFGFEPNSETRRMMLTFRFGVLCLLGFVIGVVVKFCGIIYAFDQIVAMNGEKTIVEVTESTIRVVNPIFHTGVVLGILGLFAVSIAVSLRLELQETKN